MKVEFVRTNKMASVGSLYLVAISGRQEFPQQAAKLGNNFACFHRTTLNVKAERWESTRCLKFASENRRLRYCADRMPDPWVRMGILRQHARTTGRRSIFKACRHGAFSRDEVSTCSA